MNCIDTMKIAGTTLCLGEKGIYMCEKCEGTECQNCELIPKPRYKKENKAIQYHGSIAQYGELENIKEMLTKKEFLFGIGAGLLLGALLFRR